jgi:hypothetical protein
MNKATVLVGLLLTAAALYGVMTFNKEGKSLRGDLSLA